MRSVLITQVVVAIVATLLGYLWKGEDAAPAALFGATAALVNALLLTWRMRRRPPHTDPQRQLRRCYFSVIERWLVVSLLLAIGIGVLRLMPLALLMAFIAGQLALMVAGSLSEKY